MEHFDIINAFLHEPFSFDKTVYFKEMCQAEGIYKKCKTCGILIGNMYGGKSTGNVFLKSLIQRLTLYGCSLTDFDPCLFYKKTNPETIIFSVCIHDFLVISNSDEMIDDLFKVLQAKYDIKRLRVGVPEKYLRFIVAFDNDEWVTTKQQKKI